MTIPGAENEEAIENQAYEAAQKLDDIFLGDIQILEKAIRYMGVNTRATLENSLQMAKNKM